MIRRRLGETQVVVSFFLRGRAALVAGAVLLVLVSVTATRSAGQELPAQESHREGFVPVADDVFVAVAQFFDFDRDLPLEDRVLEEWTDEEARYAKIAFTTQSGERVPGDLALPLEGDGPFPCVLLLHGLGNSRDRWWEEDRKALPSSLLEAGIAVFAIDLRYHGERSAANDYQNPVFLTMGNNLEIRNRDMVIDSTLDARRALDYLSRRSDIDGERLAVVGYSMGAMIGLYLSALEPNLSAVVASAVPTTLGRLPTDHFNFAARANAPVLLQVGRTDWLSSPADAELLRRLIPVEGSSLILYDAGHRLPPSFATDAAAWLKARLE